MLFKEIIPTVLNLPNDTTIQLLSFLITATILIAIPFVLVLLLVSYSTKTSVINILSDKFTTSPIPKPYRPLFGLFSLFVISSTLTMAVILLFYIIPFIVVFGYWLNVTIFDLLVSTRS